MNKTLVRYTIGGNPSKDGEEILRYSILKMKKIIGKRADIVLCYNNVNADKYRNLKITMINQSFYKKSLPCEPKDVAWKLYPPRLRLKSHEIFVDNDLLLEKIPEEIEEFLSNNDYFFYTEGDFKHTHGRFSEWPNNSTFNSGLFGVPPNFDFTKELSERLKDGVGWTDRFDEQGLVGSIFFKQKKIIKIKKNKINIFKNNFPKKNNFYGYHFVSSNYKKNKSWEFYKNQKIKLL